MGWDGGLCFVFVFSVYVEGVICGWCFELFFGWRVGGVLYCGVG